MSTARRQRIPEDEWAQHKTTIGRLYIEDNKNLEGPDGVMDIMLRQHKFCASKSQFETKLKSWSFAKYAKKIEWKALEQIVAARKAEGKLTDVYLYGERLKRSKVQKETTRHRHGSSKNTTLQELVRHLPQYVTVRTPTFKPASLPPNNNQDTNPRITLSRAILSDASLNDCLYSPNMTITSGRHWAQRGNSESLDVILVEASKSYLPSLHPSLDRERSYLADSFDVLPDSVDNLGFGYQFSTRSSPPPFSLAIDVAAFDRPMETLISMRGSLQRSFESLQSCNPSLFSKILQEWKKSTRRFVRPLQDIEAGKTGQLLKELPLNFAVVYRVMYLLVNNLDVLDRLKDGKDEDAFFNAGVRYIHSLPAAILNQLLDSIGPPFSYPLEQSLLCTAVEFGAKDTAIAILQRRCLELENVECIISGEAYTLLERSVKLCHVEITSALLEYGLDPNKFLTTCPIEIWAQVQLASDCETLVKEVDQEWNENKGEDRIEDFQETTTTTTLKLFALLFHAGVQLDDSLFYSYTYRRHFSGQTLRFLLDTTHGPQNDWLIDSRFLSTLMHSRHPEYAYDDVIFIAKSVLTREYSDGVRNSPVFLRELSSALSGAVTSTSPNMDVIKILLSAGATPDTSCLLQAVSCKPVEVVKLILSAGATPDTACLSRAVLNNDVEIAKALLCAGATPDNRCLAYVLANGNTELVGLLLSAKAWPGTKYLMIAMDQDNLEYMETLVSKGAVPDSDCLLRALCLNNVKVVKIFLSAGAIPDARCLPVAFYSGNLELVDLILSAGAVPEAESLICAVACGCTKVVERLLDLGVSANTMTRHRRTPLVEAIKKRQYVVLQLFQSRGFFSAPSLNPASWSEALKAACEADNVEIVQLLLSNIQKDPSSFPKHLVKWMLQHGHQEVALRLVEFGASPSVDVIVATIGVRNASLLRRYIDELGNLGSCKGKKIVYQAVQWGDLEVIKALVHAGADLHEPEYIVNQLEEYSPLLRKGEHIRATPLVASIWTGQKEVTSVLLDLGALDCQNYEHSISPLTAAIIMRDSNLVRNLLLHGADPYDYMAITIATYSQNLPLALHLLEYFGKVYPMGRVDFGVEALHEAIRKVNLPMLTILAKHADCNSFINRVVPIRDDKLSPLGAAIVSRSENYAEMMRIILENNTNVNGIVFFEFKNSRTAILHAISIRRLAAVEILIEHGAELSLDTVHWRTPLQLAAELGDEDIVQCLLRHVDPNELPAEYRGGTALQLAAIKGHFRIAVLLLGSGADVNAEPARWEGRTAFEGATEHGRMDMMFLLAQHGVDLLANDESQYKQAIRFSKANRQIGAMRLVEQMYEKAIEESVLTPGLFVDESMVASEPFEDWSAFDSH